MKILILAGGSGTRLWPISQGDHPKQFLKLPQLSGNSMFQITLERTLKIAKILDIYIIVTTPKMKQIAKEQALEIGVKIRDDNIKIGPKKDTLGAIIFGMNFCEDYALILPTDHIIKDQKHFIEQIEIAKEYAKNSLVIFGIKPTEPHTGYGYIKPKNNTNNVERFVEKPNLAKAKNYIKNNYLWNSGMFLFKKDIFFKELEKVNKEIYDFHKKPAILKLFQTIPSISIDYALLEKSKNIKYVKLDIDWFDLGSFDSLSSIQITCEDSNQGVDKTRFFSSKNNLVQDVEGKQIILSDVDDLIIVNTKETLLITKKGKSENVKKIFKELEKE